MADSTEDLTIHVLRQIREEIATTRSELRAEIGSVRAELIETRRDLGERIDVGNERLGAVEWTLRELAVQQRFVARSHGALHGRDRYFEDVVAALEKRVEAVEKRNPTEPR